MVLKLGSKGAQVKILQEALGLAQDGDFGPKTEAAVKEWQKENGLVVDGVVGPMTWDCLGLATTDNSELVIDAGDTPIHQYLLPKGEYKEGPTKKEYVFIHHTAGWNNPYKCVDDWARDTRGAVGTEFVIGGPSIKGNDNKYDGEVLQAIPEGGYGWHLGKNGNQSMHTGSVGIEVCNFGQLYERDGKQYAWPAMHNGKWRSTYKKYEAAPGQVTKGLFRGFVSWHKYSDAQIASLRDLILYIAERDGIDVRKGLVERIHKVGANEAFDFCDDAYYGRVKGLWSHTNTRKDKFDMHPQEELVDMLLSL